MKAPIFVFTDDLDIFRSTHGAEKYFEAWILEQQFAGFDSDGRVLSASTILKPGKRLFWLIPTQNESISLSETEALDPEKLRSSLVSYLKQLEKGEVALADLSKNSLAEVIEKAILLKGYSD